MREAKRVGSSVLVASAWHVCRPWLRVSSLLTSLIASGRCHLDWRSSVRWTIEYGI